MLRKTFLSAAILASCVVLSGLSVYAGEKAIHPFNGKNLKGWKLKKSNRKSHWTVGLVSLSAKNPSQLAVRVLPKGKKGALVNAKGGGVDIYTEKKFGDCTIELEVMVPKGSNSGIYVMGEYEVQILDSHGKKKMTTGDIGALYGAAPPRLNASKAPGEWQKFVINFQAPRFKNGKKVSNAKFLKVMLNGKVIQENVEMKGPTPSCLTGREAPTGPIMFQGDHGAVAFRHIRITPRK